MPAFVRPWSLAGLLVSSDPRAVQHPEHVCGDAVIALIVIEAECGVGVERVEAVVLRLRRSTIGWSAPAALAQSNRLIASFEGNVRDGFWRKRARAATSSTMHGWE
jgi:hypothetical protein